MSVTVETLEKLERKITLSVPVTLIQSEVDTRLKRLARTVKMDGFRPGKVPMTVVAQRYGYSVQYEVLNDKVGEAFAQAANEANLRVACDQLSPVTAGPFRRARRMQGRRCGSRSAVSRTGRRSGGSTRRAFRLAALLP